MFLLNKLGDADIIFFIVLAVVVAASVAAYFLLPLLNEKQYKEMRDNLRVREKAYNENLAKIAEKKKETNKLEEPTDNVPLEENE